MNSSSRPSFRSISFIDEEGDYVIKHAFMTDEEAENLLNMLIRSGVAEVSITDLTSPQSRDADVTSVHVPALESK